MVLSKVWGEARLRQKNRSVDDAQHSGYSLEAFPIYGREQMQTNNLHRLSIEQPKLLENYYGESINNIMRLANWCSHLRSLWGDQPWGKSE